MTNNKFTVKLAPIRLGEFDMGGVLYHARYFHLLEECRESFFRSISYPYEKLTKEGFHMPLIKSELNFNAPIRYGDGITGQISLEAISKLKLRFIYELFIDPYSESSKPVHRASTTHTFVVAKGDKLTSSRPPDLFYTALKPYMSSTLSDINE
ncbi:MAG TPA: thioesterase family protein [Oligoflexia bacterium]|nr:thioesterase family protein [Oligoflexia bacterium]HMP48205.1 thioesterase family protein [Oligoflexia bacterium]